MSLAFFEENVISAYVYIDKKIYVYMIDKIQF